jgi:hypothetical protein
MRGKHAQTMPLAILSFLAVFIIGLTFVNFLLPEVTTFRTEMNCASASTISDGTKLLCLFGDMTIPYVIILIVSLAVGAITSRLSL